MDTIKVGIIDDDSTKITQIITHLLEGWEKASEEKKKKYSGYSIEAMEIKISQDINDMIVSISQEKIDCVIVDYRLSSFVTVGYSGVDVVKAIQRKWNGFPVFLLTSYEDDVYTNETFDVYYVFDFDRYQSEDAERVELNSKIIEQVLKHRRELTCWQDELLALLPQSGNSAHIDNRILELDSMIENAIDGYSSLSTAERTELTCGKLNSLLEKLDQIIDKG